MNDDIKKEAEEIYQAAIERVNKATDAEVWATEDSRMRLTLADMSLPRGRLVLVENQGKDGPKLIEIGFKEPAKAAESLIVGTDDYNGTKAYPDEN